MSSISDIARVNMLDELGLSVPQLKSNTDLMELILSKDDNLSPLNSNPYLETNDNGYFSFGGSAARSTDYAHEGKYSYKITPDGITSNIKAGLTNPASPTVVPGNVYQFSLWIFIPTGYTTVRIDVVWLDSANATISTSSGTTQEAVAGEWLFLNVTATAPALSARASPRLAMLGTPLTSNITYIDELVALDSPGYQLFHRPKVGSTPAVELERYYMSLRTV